MTAHVAGGSLRLDKWLWYARLYKTRTLAAKRCDGGRIRVNGNVVDKPHYLIKEGDVLTFVWNGRVRVLRIAGLGVRRGPASEAQTLYVEIDTAAAGRAEEAGEASCSLA